MGKYLFCFSADFLFELRCVCICIYVNWAIIWTNWSRRMANACFLYCNLHMHTYVCVYLIVYVYVCTDKSKHCIPHVWIREMSPNATVTAVQQQELCVLLLHKHIHMYVCTYTNTYMHIKMYTVMHMYVFTNHNGEVLWFHFTLIHSFIYFWLFIVLTLHIFAGVVVFDLKRCHVFIFVAPSLQNNNPTHVVLNVENMFCCC